MRKDKMRSLKKIAFNDILSKGFDSVAQECFLRINKPSLAQEVFELHGHAPDWDRLKRDDRGKFDHIASICKALFKVADRLDTKQKFAEADKVDDLINYIVEIQGVEI